jgi:hypothetical protein
MPGVAHMLERAANVAETALFRRGFRAAQALPTRRLSQQIE